MCFWLCNALTVLLSSQKPDYRHGIMFAELNILLPDTTFARRDYHALQLLLMDVRKAFSVTLNRYWDRWRRSGTVGTSSHY